MSNIVMRSASLTGAGQPDSKCAAALAGWLDIQDPGEIEDAITAFVPSDQPLRDVYLDALVKVGPPCTSRTACAD